MRVKYISSKNVLIFEHRYRWLCVISGTYDNPIEDFITFLTRLQVFYSYNPFPRFVVIPVWLNFNHFVTEADITLKVECLSI